MSRELARNDYNVLPTGRQKAFAQQYERSRRTRCSECGSLSACQAVVRPFVTVPTALSAVGVYLNLLNPVYTPTPYFFKIQFDFILPSTTRSSLNVSEKFCTLCLRLPIRAISPTHLIIRDLFVLMER
jgi:hypothetical protein